LLSKYSFAGFLVVLLGAALWQPVLRARLLDWRLLLSVGAAAAVTVPFVAWLIAGRHDLVALYGSAMAPLAETNRLKATLIGLGKAIYAPLAFLFPLDLIDSGSGRSRSPIPRNRSPAPKSVSWLSRRDDHWSTNPCKVQKLNGQAAD